MKKLSLVSAAIAAATLSTGASAVDMTANAALSSNYLFRGITQTLDATAISGGVDFDLGKGLYAGAWASNVTFGQELDLYAGIVLPAGNLDLDVGVIAYRYPVAPTTSAMEVYAKTAIDKVSFEGYMVVQAGSANPADTGDIYLKAAVDLEPFTAYAGITSATTDYIHYGVSMSKDEFTFSIDKNDMGGYLGRMRVVVSWSKEFEL